MAKYDLNKPLEVNKFKTRCEKLLKDKKKVTLTDFRGARSLKQNAYQHVLFNLYAINFSVKIEHVKQIIYKIIVNNEIFRVEFVDEDSGEIYDTWRSTADLDTQETSTSIEAFRNYSHELGYYLPTADEYIEQQFYIDQEIAQHKENL